MLVKNSRTKMSVWAKGNGPQSIMEWATNYGLKGAHLYLKVQIQIGEAQLQQIQ